MSRRRLLLSLILLLSAFWRPAAAQEASLDSYVEYTFGEHVTFYAQLRTDALPVSGAIFFHSVNYPHTTVGEVQISPQQDGSYQLRYTHLLKDSALRAFGRVEYRFEIRLANGEVIKSPAYEFFYADNRQPWQILEEAPFRVSWYEGDLAFAQSVLDAAQEGLERARTFLPFGDPSTLDIYVYADPHRLQEALSPASPGWTAGHADPDLGVILVALPASAEQGLLIRQRISHELMHILLYQYTGEGYRNLPIWLNEGLASAAELYPNPDYRLLLEASAQSQTLLPMTSLCQAFPRNVGSALLAYAQSVSFVNFLYGKFGSTGLQALVRAYANGVECQRGPELALDASFAQLEKQWLQQIQANRNTSIRWEELAPWLLVLLAALLAPFSLLLWSRARKTPGLKSSAGGKSS